VVLRRRSSLIRSVLWDDVTLEEEVSLDGCVVASGVRIPPRTRLERMIVLDEATYLGDRRGLQRLGPLLLAPF